MTFGLPALANTVWLACNIAKPLHGIVCALVLVKVLLL